MPQQQHSTKGEESLDIADARLRSRLAALKTLDVEMTQLEATLGLRAAALAQRKEKLQESKLKENMKTESFKSAITLPGLVLGNGRLSFSFRCWLTYSILVIPLWYSGVLPTSIDPHFFFAVVRLFDFFNGFMWCILWYEYFLPIRFCCTNFSLCYCLAYREEGSKEVEKSCLGSKETSIP